MSKIDIAFFVFIPILVMTLFVITIDTDKNLVHLSFVALSLVQFVYSISKIIKHRSTRDGVLLVDDFGESIRYKLVLDKEAEELRDSEVISFDVKKLTKPQKQSG